MQITQCRSPFALLAFVLMVYCHAGAQVQNTPGAIGKERNPVASERSIEDLNLVGAETGMRPFSGPKSFQIYNLYFYKAFGDDRLEVKAGYIGNNLEVIGLTMGGSAATARQGVYAVLPFESGLSSVL